MNTAIKVAALVVGVSTVALVNAEEGLYAGVNLTQVAYKEDGLPTFNPIAVAFKLGKQFNKNFALEGRLGIGVSDDEVTVSGLPVSVEVDNYFGLYGKGIYPASDAVSVYGLLGFTRGELTAKAGGFSVSDSDSDLSFGLGVDFVVSPIASLNLEWARLLKGDGYKLNGISLGVNFRF